VRGGPTVVDILLDDKEILFPYAIDGEIEFMLSVAQISYDQFKNGVKEGGIIVVDPDLVHPTDEDRAKWKIYEIPIIRIAKYEVGNVVTQSVVALAIAVEMTKVMDADKVLEAMKKKVPPKVLDANIKAWELGTEYAKRALAGEDLTQIDAKAC